MDVTQLTRVLKINNASGISTLIEGNHGIAKSAIVKQHVYNCMAKQYGKDKVGFIDIRLSQMDVGDLKGIPHRVNGTTFFAPPNWFPVHEETVNLLNSWLQKVGETFQPMNDKPYGVLLLDEMNRGTREVLQCAFELVLDRSLGGVKIPDGWQVVACVNANQDIYQVAALDAALTNRFQLVTFTPTKDDWFAWAKVEVAAGRMHKAIYDYLVSHENSMDPENAAIIAAAESTEQGEALYTRRAWTNLAVYLMKAEQGGDNLLDLDVQSTAEFFLESAKGFLGSDMAIKLMTWLKTEYKTLNAREILDHMHEEGNKTLSHLKKLAKSGDRIMEITGVNNDILAELKLRTDLDSTQIGNLITYMETVPAEIVMDLFQTGMKECKKLMDKTYDWKEGRPGKKTTKPNSETLFPAKVRVFECSSKKAAMEKK